MELVFILRYKWQLSKQAYYPKQFLAQFVFSESRLYLCFFNFLIL